MNYKIKSAYPGWRFIGRLFIDPWIAMLATGAIGHRIHQPVLYHIDYWTWLLAVIVIQALWGNDYNDYNVEKE